MRRGCGVQDAFRRLTPAPKAAHFWAGDGLLHFSAFVIAPNSRPHPPLLLDSVNVPFYFAFVAGPDQSRQLHEKRLPGSDLKGLRPTPAQKVEPLSCLALPYRADDMFTADEGLSLDPHMPKRRYDDAAL